jgi:hypothetical protein
MSGLPAAPPGLPVTLAASRVAPVRWRAGVAMMVGIIFAAFTALMIWRGLPWTIALPVFGGGYLLLICSAFSATVSAGEGWLRAGGRYVRTDELTALETRVTLAGTQLAMRDRAGRRLTIRLSDLMLEPALWAVVRSGVATSFGNGLTADARAKRLFQ